MINLTYLLGETIVDKELRNTYNHTIITQMRKLVLLKWPNIMQICFYTSPIIPLLLNEIQNKTPISCFAYHCHGSCTIFFIWNISSVFPFISSHWYFDKDLLASFFCLFLVLGFFYHKSPLSSNSSNVSHDQNQDLSLWQKFWFGKCIFSFHSKWEALF